MLHGSLWSNGTSFYLRKESHIVVKNQIHPLVFCHPNSKVNIQILTFQLLTISPEQLDSPLNKRHSTSRWCSLFSQPERGLLGLERSTPVTVSTVKPSLTPHTISWLVPSGCPATEKMSWELFPQHNTRRHHHPEDPNLWISWLTCVMAYCNLCGLHLAGEVAGQAGQAWLVQSRTLQQDEPF